LSEGQIPPALLDYMGARQSSGAEKLAQVAPMPDTATQEEVEGFAEAISRTGEVVCFDMDQCIVAQHSRGRLRKVDLILTQGSTRSHAKYDPNYYCVCVHGPASGA